MRSTPIEALAAFAITFVAGAAVALAVNAYGKWMHRRGADSVGTGSISIY